MSDVEHVISHVLNYGRLPTSYTLKTFAESVLIELRKRDNDIARLIGGIEKDNYSTHKLDAVRSGVDVKLQVKRMTLKLINKHLELNKFPERLERRDTSGKRYRFVGGGSNEWIENKIDCKLSDYTLDEWMKIRDYMSIGRPPYLVKNR